MRVLLLGSYGRGKTVTGTELPYYLLFLPDIYKNINVIQNISCFRILVIATVVIRAEEVDIITEPRPGEEYVFVQTSGSGSRPVIRKEKSVDASNRPFETAHKLPDSLTFAHHDTELEPKPKEKREAAKTLAAAPPGSIKIDPLKLIEKYR